MATNLTRLKPKDAAAILNSDRSLGSVISDRTIERHLVKAGYRIAGDSERKTINLVKYAAWFIDQIEDRFRKESVKKRTYDDMKEAARQRSSEASVMGRDIGELPTVVDPVRKEQCRSNLKLFCETYFPMTFYLGWSPDHLIVIRKIETAVLKGGLFALAMPRGSGKTTLCECAVLWATLFGHRLYVVPIGASEDAAVQILDNIKIELECNELLSEDFPEVVFPIQKLEGIANRCNGQLYNGVRTRISWTEKAITLPTIAGSPASGAVIEVAGITGRIRGMKAKNAEGRAIRPDLVIIDDPQTAESANSPEQNRKRMRVLSADILGLAGPGKKIAGIMPCTVIRPDDMADQILNKGKHPEWNGERLQLMKEFPKNMDLWNRYREIWADSQRMNGDISDATDFYLEHRTEMDEGAEVSWDERHEPDEISGIQYAMNIYIRDPETFYSEYQNQPIPDDLGETEKISVQQVWKKLNNRPRGEVPAVANHLTMFIDVQKNLLYYVVCAFDENFTCWLIDYGAFPDQKRRYFTTNDANPTYPMLYPGAGREGAIYQALKDLTDDYLARTWVREDGTEMRIERCLVDSGWGLSTDVVFQICRESIYAGILLPSKGMGITAAQRAMSEYKKNVGDKIGFNWMIPSARKKRTIRYIVYDTNFWKSFFRERLLTSMGDIGSFSIYGNNEEQARLLAEHLSSETSEPTSGRGRKVDIWTMIPGRENHWLDGVVGCMVAASVAGCVFSGASVMQPASQVRQIQSKHQVPHSFRLNTGGRHFGPGRVFRAH